MKKYKTFEVVGDTSEKLKGEVNIRLDEEESSVFKKLRKIGFNINRRRNKLIWWDDEYIEIINKKTENTIGIMEIAYS
jgi:hypothetical protein